MAAPVLDERYVVQVARDWNAKCGPGFAGFVTRFHVVVGTREHRELWVPAENWNEARGPSRPTCDRRST